MAASSDISFPFFLIKFTKSKKYFGVPPEVIISGACFATAFDVDLNKVSSPKYLRKPTPAPAPIDRSRSLLV